MQLKSNKKKPLKERKTWVGLYSRKTPTKAEKLVKELRKSKSKGYENC